MRPVDYLAQIDSVMEQLFEAMKAADGRAMADEQCIRPARDFALYQAELHADEAASRRLASLEKSLMLIDSAGAAAAGAILQVAKTCVSLAWPGDAPAKGRLIGVHHLSTVIWYARNQALHFDDGARMHAATRKCLETLPQDWGLDLSSLAAHPRSLARIIVHRLGWSSYAEFATDMMALLEEP